MTASVAEDVTIIRVGSTDPEVVDYRVGVGLESRGLATIVKIGKREVNGGAKSAKAAAAATEDEDLIGQLPAGKTSATAGDEPQTKSK